MRRGPENDLAGGSARVRAVLSGADGLVGQGGGRPLAFPGVEHRLERLAESRPAPAGRDPGRRDRSNADALRPRQRKRLLSASTREDGGLGSRASRLRYLTLHASFFGGSRPTLLLRHEPETAAIIAGGL